MGGKKHVRCSGRVSARHVCGALHHQAAQTEGPALNLGRSGASPHQRSCRRSSRSETPKISIKPKEAAIGRPYLFFSIFRKNGAVLLTLLFATSSGDPVATISPPNSPASGPI